MNIYASSAVKMGEKASAERYVNEVIIEGVKLGEVCKSAMDEKLHRNIVSIVWKNHKFNQVGRGSGLLISSDLISTRINTA